MVGSFEMGAAMAKQSLFTAMHKYYTPEQWINCMQKRGSSISNHITVSTGTSQADAEKLES